MKKDILIIDDEEDIRLLLSGILQDEGYETRVASDLNSMKLELIKRTPSLILLDVWLNKGSADGIDILKVIKKSYNNVPVIMISGHGTIDMAIKAIKIGAFDFIEKPFDTNILLLCIKRAIEIAEIKRQNKELISKNNFCHNYIGKSQTSIAIRSTVEKVSTTQSRILISGPSGSGKRYLAQLIHYKSTRNNAPFLVANTKRLNTEELETYLFGVEDKEGVVTKIGLIEQSHKGTLYIDEICNLKDNLQARLIKLLTEKTILRVYGKYNIEIDVRILVGTSKNILNEINNKNFREDLYYRLNVVPIKIPSLNERIDDIPEFIDYFLKICSENLGMANIKLSKDAYNYLQSRIWNGNLRELKNVIEKILILSNKTKDGLINLEDMNLDQNQNNNEFEIFVQKKMLSLSLKKAREYFEREYIKIQMHRFNNNVSRTANFIGMERSALHRKLKNLKLN
ncbi:MAG: sigma-54-dependent Fis family transcriptional regulator [Rickettsiales bacterium TMED254]|nr:sigma-54-dependent Fis family transcriptional regulator [Rickettsiales bacterium]RPF77757.1 MAG: sigma-54-dependent Fis family transcriptional regulator [Rickettsiales bacterium TMED254]